MATILVEATITCPSCGNSALLPMARESCQVRYVCPSCGKTSDRLPGTCCVFCSYADALCPPEQEAAQEKV